MKIFGVAILATCFLVGHFIGEELGRFFNLSGNLGGVGIAMLLLVLLNHYLKKKEILKPETESGILFWSTMYIPVVVAMSATQNVKAALSGGWATIMVAVIATAACYALIPLISRMAKNSQSYKPESNA